MASKSCTQILVPAFGGQGSPQTFSLDGQAQYLSSSSLSPVGITVLSACFSAFQADLASLNLEERKKVAICASDFMERESILQPPSEMYLQNPAFSGPHLVLNHVLQYLLFIEEKNSSQDLFSFTDILDSNVRHGVGICGFSSGILSACVVGSSTTILSYINHAVEAFRLALWIGIRVQIHRAGLLTQPVCPTLPWAVVLSGMPRSVLESSVTCFNEVSCSLYVVLPIDDDHRLQGRGRKSYIRHRGDGQ